MLGLAVKNVVSNYNPSLLRRLICDLKSQAEDCPAVMKDILGTQAFEAVINL
jgi:hypothetical protein